MLMAVASPALAEHAWGPYHWARTTTSFDLIVVNSTTSDWDAYVTRAAADWSEASPLNLVEDPNGASSRTERRQCLAPAGLVRICNLAYGWTGWLGVAGISVDVDGHISAGYTKLNDTYFATSHYDTPAWKQSVTCQELGHNVGLAHQDEDFGNGSLFSCMDYQDPPYEYPNDHDYAQLDAIYSHLDGYDSYAAGGADGGGGEPGEGSGCNSPPGKGCNKARVGDNREAGWGMSLGRRGQSETFLRIDRDGTRHITHVLWVAGR